MLFSSDFKTLFIRPETIPLESEYLTYIINIWKQGRIIHRSEIHYGKMEIVEYHDLYKQKQARLMTFFEVNKSSF